jgi:hypothetical protein
MTAVQKEEFITSALKAREDTKNSIKIDLE